MKSCEIYTLSAASNPDHHLPGIPTWIQNRGLTSPFSWDARHTYSFLLCLSGTVCGISSISSEFRSQVCCSVLNTTSGFWSWCFCSRISLSNRFFLLKWQKKECCTSFSFTSRLSCVVGSSLYCQLSQLSDQYRKLERRASPSPLRHQHKLLCAFLLPSSKR